MQTTDAIPAAEGPLAAIDPGRSKCGLVRTDIWRRQIEDALILDPSACRAALLGWHRRGQLAGVVLGNGTGSRQWLQDLAGHSLPLQTVDERGTTLAARQRYWQLWPARGWRRLLPPGLRLPPRELDDIAAQILLERLLQRPLPRGPLALEQRFRSGPGL